MMTTINDINRYKSITVNPLLSPDQLFELYSVPSFDNQYPEVVTGKEIGSTKVAVQENDVLICKINPRINRVWVVKDNTQYPLIASSEWIVVRSPENDSNYLKWYFSSPQFKNLMVSQVTGIGGSLTRAQPKQVATYPVPLPDFPTQRRIANTLDKVAEGIALCRKMVDECDLMVKAKFVEMFGDPIANNKGWTMTTLGEIADIRIGPFGTMLHKEDYLKGGHALVNPSHIINGEIITDEGLTIDDKKYDELTSYHLHINDVVLGRRGEMGRCAVVHEEGLLCGTGSMIIRPNEKMRPYFLQNIISSPGYRKLIEDKAVGVTMMNLNVPIVSKLSFPLLPIDKQENFIKFMQQVDKSKLTIRRIRDKMEMEKLALMQKYFA